MPKRKKRMMDMEVAEKIFLEVCEILNKFQIKLFLSDGTALGAIRDKTFLPWDFDIDSRAMAIDWDFSIFKEFENNGFQCFKRLKARCHPELSSGVNLHKQGIDFGIGLNYYYPPEDVVVFLATKPSSHGTLQPARFYRGDHFIDFLKTRIRVPHPPEEYLEFIYGANWRKPLRDKSWLKFRKPISIEKHIKYFLENPEINKRK